MPAKQLHQTIGIFLVVPVRSYVVTEDQVTFYLHKRDSRELQLTNDNLASVDATKNVRLIVHGWIASHNENWVQKLTNAYLQQEDCNVVQVDWTEPADEPFYVSANNTKQVGRFVGKFIRKLIEELSVPPSGVSLVGHSFGSHVSGFAGKEVKASGAKVGRITVTDPARQPFESSLIDESEKLTRDDGEVVVAVHSDIGKIGYAAPIGTIDFYPNGGLDPQPGCESYGDLTRKWWVLVYDYDNDVLQIAAAIISSICS